MNHYKKWLYSTTNTYSEVTRKDVLEDMFSIIMKWFSKYPELDFLKNESLCKHNFFQCMYHNPMKSSMGDEEMEYFSLTYLADIVDIFIQCKELQNSYTTDIIDHKMTADDILLFLSDNIQVVDIEHYEEESDDLIVHDGRF
jgi:hypothetical protein